MTEITWEKKKNDQTKYCKYRFQLLSLLSRPNGPVFLWLTYYSSHQLWLDKHSSDIITVKSYLVFVRVPTVGQKVTLQVTINKRDILVNIRDAPVLLIILHVPAKTGQLATLTAALGMPAVLNKISTVSFFECWYRKYQSSWHYWAKALWKKNEFQ